jgi:drug/metabolite transporter superfamily protein YnfA
MGLSLLFGVLTLTLLWRLHARQPLSSAGRVSLIASSVLYVLAAVFWVLGVLGLRLG